MQGNQFVLCATAETVHFYEPVTILSCCKWESLPDHHLKEPLKRTQRWPQPHPRPGETPNKTSRNGQNCRQSIRNPQSRRIWALKRFACACGLILTGQWRRKVLPICFRAVSPSSIPLGPPLCVRFSINETNLNHPQESEREISSYVLMQQSPFLHRLQTHAQIIYTVEVMSSSLALLKVIKLLV